MPRHFALNSEMATSFIFLFIPWSETIVNQELRGEPKHLGGTNRGGYDLVVPLRLTQRLWHQPLRVTYSN
jgi:hypothetical protein